jgi:hypothetical protein
MTTIPVRLTRTRDPGRLEFIGTRMLEKIVSSAAAAEMSPATQR